ncbi:hypothetical protein [Legionella sp. 227]
MLIIDFFWQRPDMYISKRTEWEFDLYQSEKLAAYYFAAGILT